MPQHLWLYLGSQASALYHYFLPSLAVIGFSLSFLVLDYGSTSRQRTTYTFPQIPREFQNYNYPRPDGLGPIIGIDMGSSHSHVSYQGDEYPKFVETIANFATVEEMYPGWVFDTSIPKLSPFNFKTFLGLQYGDMEYSTCSLTDYECWFGFRLSEMQHNSRHKRVLHLGEMRYSWSTKESPAERIASHMLERLRYVAEKKLGVSVQGAVITIPNYFDEMEIAGMREAANMAGLSVFGILNEAWASGLAYDLDAIEERETVLVYNLGESIFEATIFLAEAGVFKNIATVYDEQLGAEQFNNRVVQYMIHLITSEGKESMPLDISLMSSLKVQVERANTLLSTNTSVDVEVGKFRTRLSRTLFENINDVLFRRTMDLVDTLIKTADKESHSRYTDRVDKANINRVIISGSGARMPGVPNLLENHLGKAPTDPPGISPGHAVVIGAAKRAQVMQHNDMHRDEQCTSLLDLAPLPLGVETAGGIVTHVSGGAGDFPFEKRFMFTTTVDEQEGIKFRVLEGLSLEPRYNKILSTFKIQVPPAPKGVAHINFKLAGDGKLNVTATQNELGSSTTIIIGPAMGRWNGLQINRLMIEAGLGEPEAVNQLNRMHNAHALYEGDLVIYETREQMRPFEKIWAPMSIIFNCTEQRVDDGGWTSSRIRKAMQDTEWEGEEV